MGEGLLFSQTLGTTNTREHPGAPEQTPGTDGKKESSMHGADLRWLVVFKRCLLTYDWKVIEEELHIPIYFVAEAHCRVLRDDWTSLPQVSQEARASAGP